MELVGPITPILSWRNPLDVWASEPAYLGFELLYYILLAHMLYSIASTRDASRRSHLGVIMLSAFLGGTVTEALTLLPKQVC